MKKNDFKVPAGDFLVMVSRWAFNTNIANVKWIETIWSNNPFMSKHLASSYRKLLMSESVEDQQPHGALIKFISNLDDENRVIFAKEIYEYAMNAFRYEFE